MTGRLPEVAATNEVLKVLILDDSEDDARLLGRELQRAGLSCVWTRLDSERALRRALGRERWDVVLADYRIPGFGGLPATRMIRDHDPDLPIVMVSGKVGEEVTADVLRAGAHDMVLKDRLARLAPAVRRALKNAEDRRAARAARKELKAHTAALSERVKELQVLYRVSDALLDANGDRVHPARAVVDLLPPGWQYPEVAEVRITADGDRHQTPAFRETPWMLTARIPGPGDGVPGRIDVVYLEERPDADIGPFLQEEKELLEEVARRLGDTLRRQRAVADRDRSEALHRALTEHSTDLVSIVDADGTIRYESPSLRRLLGYHPSELTGHNVFEVVHPDDRATVREAIEVAQRDPDRTPVVRYRARHADGSWRHLESTGRNLLDDPAVRGFVTNTRDITERTELEARLRQAQKLEAVGRLAGGIAHDFNNLLTIVRGNVDLLLTEAPEGTPARSELVEVLDAAERAAELTRSLLAFSRNQSLQARDVDLRRVLENAAPLLRRVVGEEVELRLAPGRDPLPVHGDPIQIQQVLVSLAVNAREAMPDGGKIRVSLRLLAPDDPAAPAGIDEPERSHVLLSVADDGPGMSEEVRRKAFEPFFSTKEGGTGLGLATVFGIVKQSGGDVRIESEPGRGTTVRIYFPAGAGAAATPEPPVPDPTGLARTG